MSNRIKTTILLTLLSVFFIYLGQMLAGDTGMVIAFGFALIMNVGSYWFSDKIVLAMYRAEILPQDHPVFQIVRDLSQQAHLPMPRVYRFPSPSPNAFATGRNPEHSAVAVSDGLLQILNEEELKGVLAHEISHITNRDTLISTIAASIASAIAMIANMAKFAAIFGGGHRDDNDRNGSSTLQMLAMAIIAPIVAMFIQMAISRSREFEADRTGATLVRSSHGLISALQKIAYASSKIPMEEATPATSHMFIINPLSGFSFTKLFMTHPPLEERISRLKSMRVY